MQLTYKINLRQQIIIHRTHKQKYKWYELRKKINRYIRVAKKIADYVVQPL